jgi:hypothetical protein
MQSDTSVRDSTFGISSSRDAWQRMLTPLAFFDSLGLLRVFTRAERHRGRRADQLQRPGGSFVSMFVPSRFLHQWAGDPFLLSPAATDAEPGSRPWSGTLDNSALDAQHVAHSAAAAALRRRLPIRWPICCALPKIVSSRLAARPTNGDSRSPTTLTTTTKSSNAALTNYAG